jgi:hypothetical protein
MEQEMDIIVISMIKESPQDLLLETFLYLQLD